MCPVFQPPLYSGNLVLNRTVIFQALRIAQQREKSRDYFEKHRQEVLKKRKRMFNQSKQTGNEENQLQQELDNSYCKHCFKPFKNLRGLWSHIAQMVPCRKFYGEEALLEIKENLAQLYSGKLKRKQPKLLTNVLSEEENNVEVSDVEGLENFVDEGEGADNSEEAKKRRQQYYQQNKPTR